LGTSARDPSVHGLAATCENYAFPHVAGGFNASADPDVGFETSALARPRAAMETPPLEDSTSVASPRV